jgi:tetratricopeptide (TPR) repeat protein
VAFRGRLHETVDACFRERNLPLPDLDAVIHHYGFTLADRVEAKKPLYLELARRDAQDRPGDPPSLFNLLIQAATAGDWDLARDAAERFRAAARARKAGVPPTVLLTQATALQRLHHHEEALRVFGELLALDPACLPAKVGRGVSLERLGRREEARRILEACIRERPDFITTYLDLADLHGRAGEPGQAEAVLRGGLEGSPSDPALWGRLIRLGVEGGAMEKAVGDAWEAIQRCPGGGSGDWHRLVGVFLLRQGAQDEGRQVLAQGLEAFPGHPDLTRLLALC